MRSRRNFLKYTFAGTGFALAGTTYWLSTSQKRAARFFRQIAADSTRHILPAPVQPKPLGWSDNNITVAWIGHATVLINFHGIRILTDPVFSDRVGVSLGLGTVGPKRYVAPALSLKELPPIDLLLLSHAHMDHMDLPSLRYFPKGTSTITAKDTADILKTTRHQQVTEFAWKQQTTLKTPAGDLQVEAFQVKHWGQRWPSEKQRGYNGYILRREGKAILFAGDTAHMPLFSEIRSRGPFEIALMPIGAYDPWIWNHCNPEQAIELANLAGAHYLVPIHHQTFRLSQEKMTEPIQRFEAALATEPERIALRQIGETFSLPKT